MNTFSTSGDDGLKAEIEAEHQVLTADEQQSLSFSTNSIGSTSYGYPSSLVQSLLTSSSPPQQPPLYDHHLTNNTPFLSASASPFDNNISSFFPSLSTQILATSYKEEEGFPNLRIEHNHDQEIRVLGSPAKKGPEELPFKRPRLETPSPLPTFKVRKEKLGDRITALQQLVSPFGKTDTASVLHEAIEYIKLLHDQVNIYDKVKDDQEHKHDLRSIGLCLVPVSSMFPVATEMTSCFWTPSHEGSFK
ncbi:hypothetical protein M8C21_004486 [Ambrosia artemisiifolia]|uniref:BHLH domain-containing protein n=1 Tax=Ambrosia artemisiifolia TaxID=4212 RepID=A0AAD5DCU6_AMBAR|nr:hypothetical protein M8C21_004486 [Ambrosia artemisiifolia]